MDKVASVCIKDFDPIFQGEIAELILGIQQVGFGIEISLGDKEESLLK